MEQKIKYSIVDEIDSKTQKYLMDAAALHVSELSYRSFITMFGVGFINTLYDDIIKNKMGFVLIAMKEDNLVGFILGCYDSDDLMKIIKKRFFKYLFLILPNLIKKPGIIMKIIETLFYSHKEKVKIKAELVVIITGSEYRSAGLGSRLISQLNDYFMKKGIEEYKVTVHEEMIRSNSFYLKNGFVLSKQFSFYNVKWNLYTNKLRRNDFCNG